MSRRLDLLLLAAEGFENNEDPFDRVLISQEERRDLAVDLAAGARLVAELRTRRVAVSATAEEAAQGG